MQSAQSWRRGWVVLAGGIAILLVVSSAAFACTIFRGKFVVSGPDGNKVRAVGNNTSMSWCPGFPTGTATAPANGGSITVSVAKAKDPCPTSRLPEGRYQIRFFNGAAFTKEPLREWQVDCMAGGTSSIGVKIGKIYVNAYGAAGPKTIALPSGLVPNGPNDESAVCISDDGGNMGNQAPLTIL